MPHSVCKVRSHCHPPYVTSFTGWEGTPLPIWVQLLCEAVGLTQVLRCVDWGDAREARSAGELIARWAPIGLADALELLSPAFSNPEVLPLLP